PPRVEPAAGGLDGRRRRPFAQLVQLVSGLGQSVAVAVYPGGLLQDALHVLPDGRDPIGAAAAPEQVLVEAAPFVVALPLDGGARSPRLGGVQRGSTSGPRSEDETLRQRVRAPPIGAVGA